jgi:hypothetical protein
MIPAPPQRTRRPVAFYDTECYPNFWLLKFKTDSGLIYSFPLYEGQTFNIETRRRIAYVFELFTTVSFNGNYYDVPMIAAALQGYEPAQLKVINDLNGNPSIISTLWKLRPAWVAKSNMRDVSIVARCKTSRTIPAHA